MIFQEFREINRKISRKCHREKRDTTSYVNEYNIIHANWYIVIDIRKL